MLLLVGIGLFALTDILVAVGVWRTITESLVVVLMFGAMAGWVRVNRVVLARIGECACERSSFEVRNIIPERYPVSGRDHAGSSADLKRRRNAPVRLMGAARDSSRSKRGR